MQKAMSVASQFQFASKKQYDLVVLGRQMTIVREKPVLFGYYRPWTFHVYVDGQPYITVTD
jgi:hypothetical protein